LFDVRIEKDYGGPVFYPITKELKEKALKSPRDGYEVVIYAQTGKWPPKDWSSPGHCLRKGYCSSLPEEASIFLYFYNFVILWIR